MSQFASTFFSFSYFTNSHKLLLKKKTHKSYKRIHLDYRTQYQQRQQESTNTRYDTKFFYI